MLSRSWGGVVRYSLPGLVLGVMLMGGLGVVLDPAVKAQGEVGPGGERPRMAMAPAAEGNGNGTIAFTSTTGGSSQLLYLIDTRARAFTIYRIDPSSVEKTVKLVGARQYQWDLKLSQWNNDQPEVAAIERSLKTLGHPTSR